MHPCMSRRIGAGLVLLGLVVVQASACWKQVSLGFRPFGAPPTRVPFSWDMFAVAIERCDLKWDPPLPLWNSANGISRLRNVAPVLEWDPVFDRRDEYREVGRAACEFALPNTRVALRCFTKDGETDDAFACP